MPILLALVGAVLAVTWLMATLPVLNQVAQSLSKIIPMPPPLTWQQIGGALQSMWLSVSTWMGQQVQPAASAIYQATAAWNAHGHANSTAHGSGLNAITKIVTTTIPAKASAAQNAAETWAGDQISFLRSQLWIVRDQAFAAAASAQAAAEAYALTQAQNVLRVAYIIRDQALGAVAAVTAALYVVRDQLTAAITAQGAADQAYSRDLFQAAETNLAAAEETLRLEIAGDIAAVEGTLALDVEGLRAQIAAVAPAVLAAITPTIAALETDVTSLENSECIKFCNPLGALGAALEAIDLAALVAFVAWAAAHPDQAGAFLQQEVAPLVEGAVQDGAQALGIRVA